MIDAIVGKKGTGKTAALVEEINKKAQSDDSTIICIEHRRHFDDLQLPYEVRMVDITEYPIEGADQLIAFLYGISSRDYDISHIYIDNLLKIMKNHNYSEDTYEKSLEELKEMNLCDFMGKLEKYSEDAELDVTVTISADYGDLPEDLQKYVREDCK